MFLTAYKVKATATGSMDLNRRCPILLSSINIRSPSIIRSLCAPAALDTKTFDELLEVHKKHVGRAPLRPLDRQKFIKASQRDSQMVERFNSRFLEWAIDCDYGNSLEDLLNKQLIYSVIENALKRKLLLSLKDLFADYFKKAEKF